MSTVSRNEIAGPAGVLEALLETPTGAPAAIALVCHPHPLHGGTMMNKVVHTLARSFVGLNAAALRFNFRGVGASQGTHDDGVGEVDDALAAAAWLRHRYPDRALYLGGFSFGAATAIAAAAKLAPAGIVTVALPYERLAADAVLPTVPWLLIHGSEDEIVALTGLQAWLAAQAIRPELVCIEGADHFYHGRLGDLAKSVEAFFGPLIGTVGR
jgi:alpha/beta superfamily hydrolase